MPNWMTQGSHRYYVEAELIFFELHGLFSIEDMQLLHELALASAKDFGYVLFVFDAHDGLSISPAARRFSGERARSFSFASASLIVGASLALRTVAQLLQNAARLFGKTRRLIEFCPSLDEVPQWLGRQRQRLRATQAAKADPTNQS
jgi:hypothetical protein